jgi:hypothetical protein
MNVAFAEGASKNLYQGRLWKVKEREKSVFARYLNQAVYLKE